MDSLTNPPAFEFRDMLYFFSHPRIPPILFTFCLLEHCLIPALAGMELTQIAPDGLKHGDPPASAPEYWDYR